MFKFFLIIAFCLLASCKTSNLVNHTIPSSRDTNQLGLVIQFNQTADTSEILHSFKEALFGCGYSAITDFFKEDLYSDHNFDLLYGAESKFLKNQRNLNRLGQLLVVKIQYVVKEDSQSNKKSVGMTSNARWIDLSSNTIVHEFYYAEKINSPDNTIGLHELQSFLGTQIYLKLCMDIQKFVAKKN